MSKTLNAILAVARERLSAGRNTGSPAPTTLGDKPAVDYAPKAGDERKFAAKHTHIDQEYPYGNKAMFTGEKVPYSLTTPAAKHMGNTIDKAVKAYESVDSIAEDDDAESIHKKLHGHWLKSNAKWTAHIMKGPKGTKHVTVTHSDGSSSVVSSHKDADRIIKEEVEVNEGRRALPPGFKNKGWNRSLSSGKKKSGAGTSDDPEYARQNKPSGEGTSADPEYARQRKETKEEVEVNEGRGTASALGKILRQKAIARRRDARNKDANASKPPVNKDDAKADPKGVAGKGKNMGEEVDPIDEASEKKLDAYRKKAHDQRSASNNPTERKDKNRHKGVHRAFDKLTGRAKVNATKEEVEQVDEISRGKLKTYIKKADQGFGKDNDRAKGLSLAHKKLWGDKKYGFKEPKVKATEEVEIDEMWKATQGEDGKHVLKHAKTGQVSKKSFESKSEAIEAAVRLNRQNNHFKEDTLVEISKGKAARYITQAHNQGANARSRADAAARDRDTEREKKNDRKDDKRSAGISIAAAKLSGSAKVNAKEEVEQVDEISKKTLGSYVKKASMEIGFKMHNAGSYPNKDPRKRDPNIKHAGKRLKGIEKATDKLTKEEVEQVDEFSIHLKHPGALTRKAKKAGESNSAYEQDHKHDKGLSGKQARFAINAKKWHHEEKELTPLTQTQIDDVIEAAVLCDKRSLGKKMGYHKKKLKSEDIGSPKFKHHQRQAHIIKGMLEDKEAE